MLLMLNTINDLNNRYLKPDQADCPDQAHWIFIGVVVGLILGLFVLWLLNCFRLPTVVEGDDHSGPLPTS